MIESIFAQYGAANVAMVANHCHAGIRQAIRRLAELEGLPQFEISRVTRGFAGWVGSIKEFYKTHPVFRRTKLSDKWPKILAQAERLVGIPTHISLHSSGIVIADGIDHYIPRQRSLNGVIVVQTEKEQSEDFLRFVKLDVLGNTSLVWCAIRCARSNNDMASI